MKFLILSRNILSTKIYRIVYLIFHLNLIVLLPVDIELFSFIKQLKYFNMNEQLGKSLGFIHFH